MSQNLSQRTDQRDLLRQQYPEARTVAEVCARIACSKHTFYNLAHLFRIRPCFRNNMLTLYAASDIDRVQAAWSAACCSRERQARERRAQQEAHDSPAQCVAHCGMWQRITRLPHICVRCAAVLFECPDVCTGKQ